MAIGERIHFIRNLRGMTQKYLGMRVGFPERSADIRMAQYESGKRTPKGSLVEAIAYYLGVSPKALAIPDIEDEHSVMHTLFALEDIYGLKIELLDGKACIYADDSVGTKPNSLHERFSAWQREADKYYRGEITREEYDRWRYTYPQVEWERTKARLDAKK